MLHGDYRQENVDQPGFCSELFSDELDVAFTFMTVGRPDPVTRNVVDELFVKEDGELVKKVFERERVGGIPRAAWR